MAGNFVQPGHMIECELSEAAVEGELVIIGALAGIAMKDIPANSVGVCAISGVWELPKKAGESVTAGQKLYRDASDKTLTTTQGSNTFVGSAFAAAQSADKTVHLLINGVPSFVL